MNDDIDWAETIEGVDWGRIALDALSSGLILAGGKVELQGFDQLATAAQLVGQKEYAAALFEAAQLDQAAGQVVAASQRRAWDERKKGRLVQSRMVAVAAAGGTTGGDLIDIEARINTEAAYRAQVAAYEGLDAARTMRLQASARRYEGSIAMDRASERVAAVHTAKQASQIRTAGSLMEKYAPAINEIVGTVAGAAVDWMFEDSSPAAGFESSSMGDDLGFFNWAT